MSMHDLWVLAMVKETSCALSYLPKSMQSQGSHALSDSVQFLHTWYPVREFFRFLWLEGWQDGESPDPPACPQKCQP
jgi:hypothetical protein